MSTDVARSHGGDDNGEDRPPPHHVPTGCEDRPPPHHCKGKRKPNLGGRAAGRLNTRDKTRNLSLKEITDKKGPVPIWFEVRIMQISQKNGQNQTNTDTGKETEYKSRENAIKGSNDKRRLNGQDQGIEERGYDLEASFAGYK
ncbi:hypothetical protein Tco_1071823, partial [Tanacetum coccineum]